MINGKEKKSQAKRKKKEVQDWSLPFCTIAPDPEHFRGANEDEPCDDARGTEFEEEKDEI